MAAANTQFAGCSRKCSGSCSAEPYLMEVKPENQTVYMDIDHLSSAPMPELQGSISKFIWPEFKRPTFKSWLDLNVLFVQSVLILFLPTQVCREAVVSHPRVSWRVSQHVSGGAPPPG